MKRIEMLVILFALFIHIIRADIRTETMSVPTAAYFGLEPRSTFAYASCRPVDVRLQRSSTACSIEPLNGTLEGDGCIAAVVDWRNPSFQSSCFFMYGIADAVRKALGNRASTSVMVLVSHVAQRGSIGSPVRSGDIFQSDKIVRGSFLPPPMQIAIVYGADWDRLGSPSSIRITDEPGQWNMAYSHWMWKTFCALLTTFMAIALLVATYFALMSFRARLLSWDMRLLVFVLAYISTLLFIPVPLVTYSSWVQSILDTTSALFYLVAFHLLLVMWASLLNSILPFESAMAQEMTIKSIRGIIYTGAGWLVLKYVLVTTRWAGIRPREPLIVTQVSRWLDALHYAVVGTIFILYCVVLNRTRGHSGSHRVRRSLKVLLSISGIGAFSFLIHALREAIYYQPSVVINAGLVVTLHGVRLLMNMIRGIGVLVVLGVKMPKPGERRSPSFDKEPEKLKTVQPNNAKKTEIPKSVATTESGWTIMTTTNTLPVSEVSSAFLSRDLGWTGVGHTGGGTTDPSMGVTPLLSVLIPRR